VSDLGTGLRLLIKAPRSATARRDLRRGLGMLKRRVRGTGPGRSLRALAEAARVLGSGGGGLGPIAKLDAARGAAVLHMGDADRALALATRLESRHPAAADPKALRADALRRTGRLDDALRAAQEAVALAPTSARIAKIAGTVALAAGDGKRAVEWLSIAAAAKPGEGSTRYNLSRALLLEERYEEALENVSAAIALAPEEPAYLEGLGHALRRSGQPERAIAAFEEALTLRPDSEAVLEAFAASLIDIGRKADAVELLEKRMPPERRPLSLARIHVRLGRHEQAIAYADEAVAIAPKDPVTRFVSAGARRGVGALNEAVEEIRRARELGDEPRFAALDAQLRGQIRTLSGSWLPAMPGTPTRLEPVAPNRVLHLLERTLPHKQNGYAIRSLYTVRAQRAAGLDPVVVTRLGFPRIDGVQRFDRVEDVEGVPHHRLVLPGLSDYWRLPKDVYLNRYAAEAAKVVQEVRPAVLQAASSYFNGLVGLALKSHFGLPLVYEVRGFQEDSWASRQMADDATSTAYYEGFARADAQCMRDADRVVTLAEVMADEITRRGVPRERISVIPNAVDVQRFAPRDRDATLVRSLGLDGYVVLGYISSLVGYEGVDVFLQGLALLIERDLPVAGLVVGDGPELEPLRALARDLGIADRIRLPGRVPHESVLDYYAMIDVFVVPRRDMRVCHLVTPLKPFEAMAMGIPLLVSDVAALHEVAEPGTRGLAFAPDQPHSLATEAARLVGDASLRRRLGEAGRAWVGRERTWARNAERYRELYADILGS
jgi:glycosyltransferase involved in cell wall biosynthesis/tetratricopeptide (TPR) repeat protein